jgi:hypothetical protein
VGVVEATSAGRICSPAAASVEGGPSCVAASIHTLIDNSVDSGAAPYSGSAAVFLGYDFGYGFGYGYPGYYPGSYCSQYPYGYNPAVGCYYPYSGPAY